MKFLKSIAVLAFSVVTLSISAENTAAAKMEFVSSSPATDPVSVYVYENATETQFVDYLGGMSVGTYGILVYAQVEEAKYQIVKRASLNGLQIYFKANTVDTHYTINFSQVVGTGMKLQKGEDTEHLIDVDAAVPGQFDCAVNEEIIFTVVMPAEADYTRDVTAGNWGTICLPKASSSFSGMDLYTVAGYVVAANAIALDPFAGPMVAGMPYIFQASADKIEVNYTGDDADAQEGANHLVGTLGDMTVSGLSYIVKDNLLWQAQDAHVPANRAYIALEDITAMDAPATSAPGRKFIAVPKAMPTDMQEVKAMEGTRKAIVNGRLVIIREGRMFNALGGMK